MIGDVLYDAVKDIRYYLRNPVTKDIYTGHLRRRIYTLLQTMKDLQHELDDADCPWCGRSKRDEPGE